MTATRSTEAASAESTDLRKGRLVKWTDERGFGFIRPEEGGGTIFVHISGFLPVARRPQEDDVVFFRVDHSGKRSKAVDVRLKALPLPDTVTIAYGVGVLWLTVLFLYVFGMVDLWAPIAAYLVMSTITFGFYYVDKKRAEAHRWRIQSTSLHVLEGVGGWPGALVGMAMLRHLTRKRDHLVVLSAIITIHLVAWVVWYLRQ